VLFAGVARDANGPGPGAAELIVGQPRLLDFSAPLFDQRSRLLRTQNDRRKVMKRSSPLSIAIAGMLVASLAGAGAVPTPQQKTETAQQKMATVDYLVGTWSCGHTVGTFAGKYSTTYTKVLGNLWLKQSYDFPPQQFADHNEPAVTAETLIGFDERRQAWVRFFANSNGQYFAIRMTETGNGWSYKYISFFPRTKPETPDADATLTKKSDTEYTVDGPTYPQDGKLVTEHHSCHKI
jgi:hypothetical protein